jgi:hypothetical protein
LELTLRVLVSFRKSNAAQNVRQDIRMDGLEAGLSQIIHDVLDGNADILWKIDQSTAVLLQQNEGYHLELMQALSTRSVTKSAFTQLRRGTGIPELSDSKVHERVEEIILSQLNYRTIRDREHNIEPAHEATFKWIFSESSIVHDGGENLASWLRNGSGIFWIRGKAASGKSTLMKFIAAAEKTEEILATWAGKSRLLVDSFYFWNIGTDEQKSQLGLLRSVLLSVLRANRTLIQQTIPEVYYDEIKQAVRLNGSPENTKSLSLHEVKAAFLKFARNLPAHLKVCLLIDGLDEYEGYVPDLLSLLQCVVSENFKMIVSSRPESPCVAALKDYPHLRLEVLTRPDIMSYTKARLS